MSLWDFLHQQLWVRLPYPTTDFSGQTIIVTGANVGLGLEAARHFVRLHAAKVILAVRNLEKGQEAKKNIEASTQTQGVVEVWQLDLGSYESTKQFAVKAEGLKRLDVVVENAGIATREYAVMEDNESTITTNVISTYLLGLMILPKLRETALNFNVTPHLTIVSSSVHFYTTFPERTSPEILETLNNKESAVMTDRYNVSKLLEVLYTRELATRTKASGKTDVIINYLCPGLCHSSLSRNAPFTLEILKFFLARSTEHGSRALVHAAGAGFETHGQYLANCHVTDPSPFVRSEEGGKTQERVWEEVSKKLENLQPGIIANV